MLYCSRPSAQKALRAPWINCLQAALPNRTGAPPTAAPAACCPLPLTPLDRSLQWQCSPSRAIAQPCSLYTGTSVGAMRPASQHVNGCTKVFDKRPRSLPFKGWYAVAPTCVIHFFMPCAGLPGESANLSDCNADAQCPGRHA